MLDFIRTRLPRRAEEKLALSVLAGAFLLFAFQPAHAHEYKAGDLEIEHPWTRMTPTGAKVGGGYMVIDNHGKTPDRLVSATATVAERVEIHEMSEKDGVMTMRLQPDGVAIPAGGKVAFAPGGFHLMMIGLKQPLKQGERIKGALTFEKAGTVNVEFAVEGMGGPKGSPAAGDMSGHDMSGHDMGSMPGMPAN